MDAAARDRRPDARPDARPDDRSDPLARAAALEGVPSAFAAVRDGIDTLLRDRGLRRTAPELTAESLLRGAHASAALEGSESSLEQVRAGEGDEIAQAALRVSTEVLAQAPVFLRSPLAALARLHMLAAGRDGGRPRDAASAARLRALAELVTAPSSAPALVLAAVVHADLAVAAPFASYNGVVARAAERMVLAAKGVDAKSLVVPEAGHLRLAGAYAANLRRFADEADGRSGVHAWLLYAAEAYAAGTDASPLGPR